MWCVMANGYENYNPSNVGQINPAQQSRPPQSNIPFQNTYRPRNRSYTIIIITGIILLMIGSIILISFNFVGEPDSPIRSEYDSTSDYNKALEKYQKDTKSYANNKRIVQTLGYLLQQISLIVITLGLIIGAIKDDSLPDQARLGMFIAIGLILGFRIYAYISM